MMKNFTKIVLLSAFLSVGTTFTTLNANDHGVKQGTVLSYDSSTKKGLLKAADGTIHQFQNSKHVNFEEGDDVVFIIISAGGKGKGSTIDIVRGVKK